MAREKPRQAGHQPAHREGRRQFQAQDLVVEAGAKG
jgi:hypothetical protein